MENKTAANMEKVEIGDDTIVTELMCWKCGYRYLGNYPKTMFLSELQCPACKDQGHVFRTGEDLDKPGLRIQFAAQSNA